MIIVDKFTKRIYESGDIKEDGNFFYKERMPGSIFMYQKDGVEIMELLEDTNIDIYADIIYAVIRGQIVEV